MTCVLKFGRLMKKTLPLVFLVFIISIYLIGCLAHQKQISSPSAHKGFSEAVRVVDPGRLQQGGKLLIVPLTAGEGVAATIELDKTILMFIKGVADELSSASLPLTLITSDEGSLSDLMVRGHVIEFKKPQGLKSKIWNKGITLSFQGRMLDNKTKKEVLNFTLYKETKDTKADIKQLGYEMGQDFVKSISAQVRDKELPSP